MKAAGKNDDEFAGQLPHDERAGVAGDGDFREAGNLLIWNADGGIDLVGETAESRAKDDRRFGHAAAERRTQRVGGGTSRGGAVLAHAAALRSASMSACALVSSRSRSLHGMN